MGRTIAPLERVGTKRENFFCQRKVRTHCEFQRNNGDSRRDVGEMGSVKGETKSVNFGKGKCKLIAKCEYLARESVNSSPILARQW